MLDVSSRIIAMYSGRIMRTGTSDEVTVDNLVQALPGLCGDVAA